jgi:hypothetical protein
MTRFLKTRQFIWSFFNLFELHSTSQKEPTKPTKKVKPSLPPHRQKIDSINQQRSPPL